MTLSNPEAQGLTPYSRFILYGLVLPLLFIAGVQLFILSEQTETFFAWTFAAPFSAAYLGAGYWAAMFNAYLGLRANTWSRVRSSMPGAILATTLLSITTFLHFENFHLDSPLFITRFVTWVWIAVYVVVPPMLLVAWLVQSRLPEAKVKGKDPLPGWLRSGFALLAVFAIPTGLALFLAPEAMSTVWPWKVTPLAARAVSSWLTAFGVVCAFLVFENDIKFCAGACASLFAFCLLELVVVARYAPAFDWSRPLGIPYILFLVLGVGVAGTNLWLERRLKA